MSCWLLNREDYIKCATDVYNLLDSKELGEGVAKLYTINKKAYTYRYDVNTSIKKIEEKEWCQSNGIEQKPENFFRILAFFKCVLYQCDETEKIYNEAKSIVEKVIYKLARDIFEDESDKFQWGEY